MPTGTLARYRNDRKYGHIRSDEDGAEIFAHITEFTDGTQPERGARYQFDIGTHAGRPVATNVRPVE